MREIAGNIFLVLGIIFISFGVFGELKYKDLYSRILVASKVDTVGLLTILTGMIIKSGFNYFSFKILLIAILCVITNPMSTHSIAASAFNSGYGLKKERGKRNR